MKTYLITACIAGLLILPRASTGQASCQVTVEAGVEVAPGKLSLADLLSADTCPGLTRAAAAVDLGSAPLAGSVRVLAGVEVRALLDRLAQSLEPGAVAGLPTSFPTMPVRKTPFPEMFIPERISIRRAGARASCADLGARLLPNPMLASPTDCGAAGRIGQQTAVQLTKAVWDPALATWEVSARCVRSADCVPFLVRVPGSGSPAERATVSSSSKAEPVAISGKPVVHSDLVRPGETVTLLWDQDGIRLTVSAVCLDAGSEGQRVRARILNGGRTLPAIVVGAGLLRTVS